MRHTDEAVARWVKAAPPITAEQAQRLRDLLPPVEVADKPKPRPKPSPKPAPTKPRKPPRYGERAA